MSEVTKSKNEGRVAAGKRLAEWNRKNKENLLKNKEQVETSTSSSASEVNSSVGKVPTSQLALGGVAVVIGIAIVFWKRRSTPQEAPKIDGDIFRMI